MTRNLLRLTTLLLLSGLVLACDPTPTSSSPTPFPVTTTRVIIEPVPTNTPTLLDPLPTITPDNKTIIESTPPWRTLTTRPSVPYTAFDFLSDYLTNQTWQRIIEGKPWTNNTVNVVQLQEELGGVTYWDFFSEPENWDSPFYMWQRDDGQWQPYQKETIRTSAGAELAGYVLLDRQGPGAMDRLWFTQDAVWMLTTEQSRQDVGPIKNMDELIEWGNLDKLGNLRIEVDGRVVYDAPILEWISGKAFRLTPELTQILTWRHREFGSTGNIIPILYQQRLRVLTYGGTKKPKWFLATGVRFANNVRVLSYTNSSTDLPIDQMNALARHVLQPDKFLDSLENRRTITSRVEPTNPAVIQFNGAGTLAALQFEIAKPNDPKQLWLRIKYDDTLAINLPLSAFFGDQDYVVPHRSSPIGIIETSNAYLFYSNLPLPYQAGMTIELSSKQAMTVSTRLALTPQLAQTQLWVAFNPLTKLAVYSPDYQVMLEGNGKLVGIVLETADQELDKIPKIFVPGKPGVQDPVKRAWPMGYLEGNLMLKDGEGNTRIFGGHEDWADGGFYFNRGYTEPPGGSNRPFGGILRYKDGKEGYATIFRYFNDLAAFRFRNGLTLSFGHGTWKNNFPVSYGTTIFYYRDVQ